ncbi:MAG: hypothetical protein JXR16_05730 [Bermanella sp.]
MSWWKLDNPYLLKWHEPFAYIKSFSAERRSPVFIYILFIAVFSIVSILNIIHGVNDYFPIGLLISFGAGIGLSAFAWLISFLPQNGAITNEGILIVGTYMKFEEIKFVSIGKRVKDDKEYNVLTVVCKDNIQSEIAINNGEFIDRLSQTLAKLPIEVR